MSILKEYRFMPHSSTLVTQFITQENADILKRQITEGYAITTIASANFNLLYPGRVSNQSQIVSEVNQTMANFCHPR